MRWENLLSGLFLSAALPCALAHGNHAATTAAEEEQEPAVTQEQLDELQAKWGQGWSFTGISTFGHLKHYECLLDPSINYDIAIVGAPFDTAVSYRPGARFGPRAIRAASARQMAPNTYNTRAGINPYMSWAKVVDCGDIPVSPMDNGVAERQLEQAFFELGNRKSINVHPGIAGQRPKLITLGGDHSITLPALRALYKIYKKPITVIHFDAHLDTWNPVRYSAYWTSEQSRWNHGSFFHTASVEGLISNTSSVHAGLRTRLTGVSDSDYTNPGPEQGFYRIHADDIDDIGPKGVIEAIIRRTGIDPEQPVYLSLDIDVLDPGIAPGTGTPEPGGWTTRELIRILRGIEDLNVVGADIVEVSPSYDGNGEATALAAAQVGFEFLTSMVKLGVDGVGGWYGAKTAEQEEKVLEKDEL